jgi:hypothetical protein
MWMGSTTCLLTVHGIGFEQPPEGGRPGYADGLHAALHAVLGDRLGDDPERPGSAGPVYVTSHVDGSRAEGLARLRPGRPLTEDGRIAHVALVYSPSEPTRPSAVTTADALARVALHHGQYASAVGTLRMIIEDAWAGLRHHSRRRAGHLVPRAPATGGSPSTVRALEDDAATYLSRNDVRERVRGFVQDAVLALLDRDDVDAVIVNAHSQGTVVCWDVLCRLPFLSWRASGDRRAEMIRYFVTAGSPIRKQIDLFSWGEQVGQLAAFAGGGEPPMGWRNFWDPKDPVADPLDPPASWRPGEGKGRRSAGDPGLLVATDPETGEQRHFGVVDVKVDNVANSPGGALRAHDYWANQAQFVPALAALLTGKGH